MKRTLLFIFIVIVCTGAALAQTITPAVTVYKEFRPAKVFLTSGKTTRLTLANIFLKNSSLLYKSGMQTMEARMETISRVEFSDRTYYRIDTVLAYRIDTIGDDALYRADRIDFEAFYQSRVNNVDITSIDMGDLLQYSTADQANEDDIHFPVVPVYYYRLNGKYVLVHERNIQRVLSKDKRQKLKFMAAQEGFSWTDVESLMTLLKMIR
ncbi:MAG: hypothetical protein IJ637_05225 [Prevotella sp.]|nr:hypothetical protein [Prevotella sp.]